MASTNDIQASDVGCGRDADEREKIRSDLKNCNASWSLCRGRLARETLANKWRGLCDKMLVWGVGTGFEFPPM
jgi:hypothetical protein